MQDVGIIIVTHNSAFEIGPCLDAAVSTGGHVVVIDNDSRDSTRVEVERRGVRLIANSRNLGFAAAVNQGVRALDAPLLLLLNPDAILETSIEPLCSACNQSQTAAAGGMLVDESGKPQVGFMVRRFPTPAALCLEALLVNRIYPRNRINWQYRCLGVSYASPIEVEQPAGAFLMIRRDVWEKLGGFDENFYPLWFEDVDFLKRAKDLGFHVRFEPKAVAKHTGAHSIRKISLEFRELYWYRSVLTYAAKHYPPGAEKAVCLAVIIGSVLRTVLGIPRQRSLKPIAVYGRVVRLAGRRLLY